MIQVFNIFKSVTTQDEQHAVQTNLLSEIDRKQIDLAKSEVLRIISLQIEIGLNLEILSIEQAAKIGGKVIAGPCKWKK